MPNPDPTGGDPGDRSLYDSLHIGNIRRPKGAIHRHGGFPLRVAQDTAFLFDFKAGDRFFWPSDMGWMVGPYSTFAALLLKGALVLYSGSPDWPDMGRLRAVARAASVTHFGTSPTAIRSMAADEDKVLKVSAPRLRILMTGGEAIDEEGRMRGLFHRFGASASRSLITPAVQSARARS